MLKYTVLLQALIVCVAVYVLIKLIVALRVTVHLKVKPNNSETLFDFAHLQKGKSEGDGYDIRLVSDHTQVVGKLVVKDEKCWLFTPTSNNSYSSDKMKYSEIGYVDTEGYIYVAKRGQKPERIGFLARPSNPTVPTLKGERRWKDLWLKSRLNVYFGDPDGNLPRLVSPAEKLNVNPAKGDGKTVIYEEPIKEEGRESLSFAARPRKKTVDEATPEELGSEPVLDLAPEPTVVTDATELLPTEVVPESEHSAESEPTVEPEVIQEKEVLAAPESGDAEEPAADVKADPEALSEPITATELSVEPEVEIPEETPPAVAPVLPVQEYIIDDVEKAYLESIAKNHSDILNEIMQEMVKIEGGDFIMGSGDDTTNEGPAHKVSLSSYCIGRYPVTQRIWTAIMGYNHSDQISDDYPIAPVDWNECMLFVNRLNAVTGIKFSLPTEAQWEYAARGGSYSHEYLYAGSNNRELVACDSAYSPVGKKKPNELGLYDMSGLVREWCSDWYSLRYSAEDQFDPMGPPMPDDPEERKHVIRSPFGNDSVISRKGELANNPKCFKSYGFRLACVPDEKLGRKEKPVLVGQSVKRGFFGGSSAMCPITDEAQGAIFSLFYSRYGKNRYKEYLGSAPYGWADTALLSSILFTAVFLIVYFVNVSIFQMPLLGKDLRSIPLMTAFFFVLWAAVRAIKIECAENGNSFQPVLDLLNKSVGHKNLDLIIMPLAYLCAVWTFFFYDADFIPLILAIAIGLTVNRLTRKTSEPWAVIDPLDKSNSESQIEVDVDDDPEEIILKAPEGETKREYVWKLDSFEDKTVQARLSVSFKMEEINKQRLKNPFFLEKPDMKSDDYKNYIEKMKRVFFSEELYNYHTRYILQEILKMARKNTMREEDTLQFVLDFVQEAIDYNLDEECDELARPKEYIRYPDELLFDKRGDCDCKAFFAGALYYYLGYDVMLLISRNVGHAAVAVAVKDKSAASSFGKSGDLDDYMLDIEGRKYYYCETTTDGYLIGDPPEGITVNSFETRIEWRHEDEE